MREVFVQPKARQSHALCLWWHSGTQSFPLLTPCSATHPSNPSDGRPAKAADANGPSSLSLRLRLFVLCLLRCAITGDNSTMSACAPPSGDPDRDGLRPRGTSDRTTTIPGANSRPSGESPRWDLLWGAGPVVVFILESAARFMREALRWRQRPRKVLDSDGLWRERGKGSRGSRRRRRPRAS